MRSRHRADVRVAKARRAYALERVELKDPQSKAKPITEKELADAIAAGKFTRIKSRK